MAFFDKVAPNYDLWFWLLTKRPRRRLMKLLLLQNMLYVQTLGGANKANRALLEQLASRGHTCQVIVPAIGSHGPQSLSEFARELGARKIQVRSQSADAFVFDHRGVEVHAVLNTDSLHRYVLKQAQQCYPDEILVSSQDPGQLLLNAALQSGAGPVVYLVHCVLDLPFGPHAIFKSSATTRLIRQVNGIITVSTFLKDYMTQWGGVDSSVLRFPVYGLAPVSRTASSERKFVTFINPCACKGISIFLKLLELFPGVEFAALPAWGTTETDLARLKMFNNITLLEPSDDIGTILAQTSVLLVPSLIPEGFGIIVVEAMLRGIPVIASNAGGLAEAKLGVDYILPVHPIGSYEQEFDSRNSPVPIIPEQNIAPWQEALHCLLAQRERYKAVAEASRIAALNFVSKTGIVDFETFFEKTSQSSPSHGQPCHGENRPDEVRAKARNSLLDNLSPKKRTLLALRALKARNSGIPNPPDGTNPTRQ
jgi:glycosyltransferase involved in cell wall biosynthesis